MKVLTKEEVVIRSTNYAISMYLRTHNFKDSFAQIIKCNEYWQGILEMNV